ncbi:branched-chain amino acid ABC transporter permease [Phaeobacter gallaeciensis]|uniref:ABC-type branched-chain amino acid transport system, permease component n=1 Tax=Phaeobacter gallaeciensis TaxID=60890 RepID=A0AAC9ZAK7_9RHOB|nr:branched-chain amino acid ABC transporter permease [Phaeobacter gallaeciensis]AHD11009.1 ABC-type branched-chain amino acid transport system, permease component [Phaeobacter gallaeciensis DSM 26640]ATE94272.1 ABC-type branched-chain amino acid transport system, permease component [Phaeobacter gallaeciensis]ATE95907.1 ABC-type branched-chain amino acid transport system, permease component [Phaeobacter gallaeciensis]ATF02936.1 ABC-type branched-chain amino acid transport system, permease compo
MLNNIPLFVHFLAALAIAAVLPMVLPSYVLATEILLFGLAVIGCNLLLGYTGLLSFGQALFFGSGAYFAGLMSIHLNFDIVSTLVITMVLGSLIAVFVGFFAIRRAGIYFIMLTLAFAQLGYYIAFLAEPITGGEDGLLDIQRPAFSVPFVAKIEFSSDLSFYLLTGTIFVLVFVLMQRLVSSPLGTVLRAIKQNEARAEAIGYNVTLYKIIVFAFSGAITALAGALYAFMLKFAPLSNIDLETSSQILFMTILGGLGSIYGSVLGSAVFLIASDFFAELWPRWMILLGLLLIFVMLYMPGGVSKSLESLFHKLSAANGKRGKKP